jgi:hypothetical protein
MNNHESTQIVTNSERLLFKDEVFQIVGCAIEVLNTLGHGLVELSVHHELAFRSDS